MRVNGAFTFSMCVEFIDKTCGQLSFSHHFAGKGYFVLFAVC